MTQLYIKVKKMNLRGMFLLKFTTQSENTHTAYTTKVISNYSLYNMSRFMRKPTFLFPTWSDTNQAVHLQKMARGLKFQIKKVEGFYYLCSKNKGADQLCGPRICSVSLCSHMQNVGFLMMRLNYDYSRLVEAR